MAAFKRCQGCLGSKDARNIAMLSAFVFLLAFKPSEPHLTRYFLDQKQFSSTVVNDEIYPVWTYAYLPLLVLAAPLAEAWGYRRVILLGTSLRVATRLLLIFGTGKAVMQAMEALYAGGSVAEIVLSAYVFRVVDQGRYEEGVAATQAAYFISHVLSGVVGDVMTQAFGWSLVSTFWVSLVTVSAAAVVAVVGLPEDSSGGGRGSRLAAPAGVTKPADAPTAGAAPASCWSKVRFVGRALRSRSYGPAALLWCGGNCAWLFIYGWETSIYEVWQPHGSDWNGSVLGLGLVVAAAAAGLVAWAPVRRAVAATPFLVVAVASVVAVGTAVATASAAWPWGLVALLGYMFSWQLANAAFLAASARRVDAVVKEGDEDGRDGSSSAAAWGRDRAGSPAAAPRGEAVADAAWGHPGDTGKWNGPAGTGGAEASAETLLPRDGSSVVAAPDESPYSLLLLLLNCASLLLQTGLQAWWLTGLQVDVSSLFLYSAVMFGGFVAAAVGVRAAVACAVAGAQGDG